MIIELIKWDEDKSEYTREEVQAIGVSFTCSFREYKGERIEIHPEFPEKGGKIKPHLVIRSSTYPLTIQLKAANTMNVGVNTNA